MNLRFVNFVSTDHYNRFLTCPDPFKALSGDDEPLTPLFPPKKVLVLLWGANREKISQNQRRKGIDLQKKVFMFLC